MSAGLDELSRLIVAVVIGVVIGLDREMRGKPWAYARWRLWRSAR